MIALLRFAISKEPYTWGWIMFLTCVNTWFQIKGESHWAAWVMLAVVYVALLRGAAGHRRTMQRLQQQHDTEAVDFANHVLRNRDKRSIAPISANDLVRYRKFKA